LRVFYLTKIYSKYIKNVGIKLASLTCRGIILFRLTWTLYENIDVIIKERHICMVTCHLSLRIECVLKRSDAIEQGIIGELNIE
jgi:hypothetical protein